jgi:hypothetical protein
MTKTVTPVQAFVAAALADADAEPARLRAEEAARLQARKVPFPEAIADPAELVKAGAAFDVTPVAARCVEIGDSIVAGFLGTVIVTARAVEAIAVPGDPGSLRRMLHRAHTFTEMFGGERSVRDTAPIDFMAERSAGETVRLVIERVPTRSGGRFVLIHTTEERCPCWTRTQ